MVASLPSSKISRANTTGCELLEGLLFSLLVLFSLLPVFLLHQTDPVPDHWSVKIAINHLDSGYDTTNKQPKMPEWDFKKKNEI